MNFDLHGVHGYSLKNSTREYVEKKLRRLEHLERHISDLHIRLGNDASGEYEAASEIHFSKANIAHISALDRELFSAIDQLFDKIVNRVRREKEKKQKK